ncbi:MAG TPA: hypothetical protein VET85_03355 [Stellaceae bacterium]|nr:hypothetical protein [Stellaceae bacterium]
MDAVLQIVAWAAALTSLFLVGDMIAADVAIRRAERADHRRARAFGRRARR